MYNKGMLHVNPDSKWIENPIGFDSGKIFISIYSFEFGTLEFTVPESETLKLYDKMKKYFEDKK